MWKSIIRTFVSFERFFINTYLLANTYVVISDDSEPSWLKLKDFQLGSARDLFHFSSKTSQNSILSWRSIFD